MDKVRLVYEQTGRARWISHLDAMRTLQRILLRAQVPIRYSEGFNPHALISVLLPLSVGTESLCQIADIRLREAVDLAALPEKLTAVSPEGLRFTAAYEDGEKPVALKWLEVRGLWEYDEADPDETAAALTELFSAPVQVRRRTKRGEGTLVITEHIRSVRFAPAAEGVEVQCTLSCAEPVVNPDLLTAAVEQNAPTLKPDAAHFCRLALYKADGTTFH